MSSKSAGGGIGAGIGCEGGAGGAGCVDGVGDGVGIGGVGSGAIVMQLLNPTRLVKLISKTVKTIFFLMSQLLVICETSWFIHIAVTLLILPQNMLEENILTQHINYNLNCHAAKCSGAQGS